MHCLRIPRLGCRRTRLVVSRRLGEALDIGGDVSVTILAVSGRSVRLAITAPRSTTILRRELRALELEVRDHE